MQALVCRTGGRAPPPPQPPRFVKPCKRMSGLAAIEVYKKTKFSYQNITNIQVSDQNVISLLLSSKTVDKLAMFFPRYIEKNIGESRSFLNVNMEKTDVCLCKSYGNVEKIEVFLCKYGENRGFPSEM